ncbi:efflux RND transporter periplasmic adaptor subunit [Hephaestia mangrovi]|uniref:efflux RND transporter periplasmic adaptor subunit n=1 Tax=Hephaestia mangrovi TaxID=2873268 RepID=UPI001CA65672|nr:efflux RND transporter periplasmic adaptor subunit [Hephaestia mangrovi]MBY8829828.1 efflux RND transporter periplasmic adaptor subunit [Hephaestia mangrovi]
MARAFKRWRWAIAIVGLLLLGLGYAFWPEPKAVDLGVVTRGPMAVGVTDDGVTREKELYVVTAPVTGFAARIGFDAGDSIHKGQVITKIAARPTAPLDQRTQEELEGALASAHATATSAAAALAQAERDLARAEALDRQGFIARAQLEATRTRVATDRAALAQARAEARRIAASLGDAGRVARGRPVAVTAPVSGAVLQVPSESEGMVAEGATLMTIGDPTQIEVVVDLLSREAVRVKPGGRAEITQWGGDTLVGHVESIEPYGWLKISALGIEEQRVNVIIGFDPAAARAAARLGHGYQVDVTIILWHSPDAVRVPIGALFRGTDGGWRIFVENRGRVRERAIAIGHVNEDFAEVRARLSVGDRVVLNPGRALNDGDRVRPR